MSQKPKNPNKDKVRTRGTGKPDCLKHVPKTEQSHIGSEFSGQKKCTTMLPIKDTEAQKQGVAISSKDKVRKRGTGNPDCLKHVLKTTYAN